MTQVVLFREVAQDATHSIADLAVPTGWWAHGYNHSANQLLGITGVWTAGKLFGGE
jgi:hypothetical protein